MLLGSLLGGADGSTACNTAGRCCSYVESRSSEPADRIRESSTPDLMAWPATAQQHAPTVASGLAPRPAAAAPPSSWPPVFRRPGVLVPLPIVIARPRWIAGEHASERQPPVSCPCLAWLLEAQRLPKQVATIGANQRPACSVGQGTGGAAWGRLCRAHSPSPRHLCTRCAVRCAPCKTGHALEPSPLALEQGTRRSAHGCGERGMALQSQVKALSSTRNAIGA